jgi:hypothetical protein
MGISMMDRRTIAYERTPGKDSHNTPCLVNRLLGTSIDPDDAATKKQYIASSTTTMGLKTALLDRVHLH